MAIEKIYLYQNTSVIQVSGFKPWTAAVFAVSFLLSFANNSAVFVQDEVLCHRIGLLPLKVDPRKFVMPTEKVSCFITASLA